MGVAHYLSQPALPEVPRRNRQGVAGRARGRSPPGAVLSCGVHTAGADRRHRLSEQDGDLRPAVQSLGRDHAHDRGRSQASRRSHRLHLGAPHLGLRAHPPPACPHGRTGWRPVAGWIEVDRVPPTLFSDRGGSLGAIPQAVAADAGRSPRRRPPAVLRRSCAARRQGCIQGLSGATAQDQLGGLRKEPFAGPRQVLRYLSRFTHRIAISNRRLLSADENGVTFNYKDYRIEGPARYKTMTLPTNEFIPRFLIHVLLKGFHRIRHYGLLANGNRPRNIANARQLLALPARPSCARTPEAALEQPRA